jgi:hypothetical protein
MDGDMLCGGGGARKREIEEVEERVEHDSTRKPAPALSYPFLSIN